MEFIQDLGFITLIDEAVILDDASPDHEMLVHCMFVREIRLPHIVNMAQVRNIKTGWLFTFIFLFITCGYMTFVKHIQFYRKIPRNHKYVDHVNVFSNKDANGIPFDVSDINKLKISEHFKREYQYYYSDPIISAENAKLNTLRLRLFPFSNSSQYSKFFINVKRSNEIPVRRRIPDTRPYECRKISYTNPTLPKISVIIPVHDEPWSTLLRTVHSVLDRTPKELLTEIILVDDQSELDYLGNSLKEYVGELHKVHIIRSKERLGTMKCRIFGAKHAQGQVLAFLDSHTEVNIGWAEPILWEIYKNRHSVIQPAIDVIEPDTFEYSKYMENMRGDFEWTMGFTFAPIPPRLMAGRNPSDPIITPAFVGCSFAIDRDYFFEIGGLDSGMKTWGAEDVELALKVWLCGGNVKILECSRVGHVFKKGHPFHMEYADLLYNERRVAEMWLDEYKSIFYSVHQGRVKPPENYDSFQGTLDVKKRLKCRNFQWFLDTIFPELEVPPTGSIKFGKMKNDGGYLCVGLSKIMTVSPFEMKQCWGYHSENLALTKQGNLMIKNKCIDVHNYYLVLTNCGGSGNWRFNKYKQIEWKDGYLCVMQVIDPDIKTGNRQTVMLMPCKAEKSVLKFSKWSFTYTLNN